MYSFLSELFVRIPFIHNFVATLNAIFIMKNFLFIIVFTFAFLNVIKANVTQVDDPIIMTEKFDNPIGGHGDPGKSSSFLYIYQSGNVFYFGEAFVGCAVTLLSNNVTVFSTVVDENGQVVIPTTLTGVFELQIIVDGVVYWAEVIL